MFGPDFETIRMTNALLVGGVIGIYGGVYILAKGLESIKDEIVELRHQVNKS